MVLKKRRLFLLQLHCLWLLGSKSIVAKGLPEGFADEPVTLFMASWIEEYLMYIVYPAFFQIVIPPSML